MEGKGMSIKKTIQMYANVKQIISETTMNKGIAKNIENNELKNKLMVLEIEYRKRYKQLLDDYNAEKRKIYIQHQNKITNIDFQ
jgi:hypothetical protein